MPILTWKGMISSSMHFTQFSLLPGTDVVLAELEEHRWPPWARAPDPAARRRQDSSKVTLGVFEGSEDMPHVPCFAEADNFVGVHAFGQALHRHRPSGRTSTS